MKVKIISRAELHKMFEEEEAVFGEDCVDGWYSPVGEREIAAHTYSLWKDERDGKIYAIETSKTVRMGFNSNEDGKEEEFARIMEREGRCKASWGCTGRTLHEMLAYDLAKKFPQYRFVIGYNYECEAFDDHRLVLQPGFNPEIEIEGDAV